MAVEISGHGFIELSSFNMDEMCYGHGLDGHVLLPQLLTMFTENCGLIVGGRDQKHARKGVSLHSKLQHD